MREGDQRPLSEGRERQEQGSDAPPVMVLINVLQAGEKRKALGLVVGGGGPLPAPGTHQPERGVPAGSARPRYPSRRIKRHE